MKPNATPTWPEGRRFAFTIFDDPDGQSFGTTKLVYSFLADLGFRTTVGVWPLGVRHETNSGGETCANPKYRAFLQELQRKGFEIGFHLAGPFDSTHTETIEALDLFKEYFDLLGPGASRRLAARALQRCHPGSYAQPTLWSSGGPSQLLGRCLPRAHPILP